MLDLTIRYRGMRYPLSLEGAVVEVRDPFSRQIIAEIPGPTAARYLAYWTLMMDTVRGAALMQEPTAGAPGLYAEPQVTARMPLAKSRRPTLDTATGRQLVRAARRLKAR